MQLTQNEWRSAERLIQQALQEDNVRHDITTKLFIPPRARARAVIFARESGVISGTDISKKVFSRVNPGLRVHINTKDASRVKSGQIVMTITGPLGSILSAERSALNFLGHLSGVATLTRRFVDKIRPYRVQILDTRKTTPGWRLLEKYAVRSGGGFNHRYCLKEVAFIKDNHWRFREDERWEKASRLIQKSGRKLVVEVENEKELEEALKLKPYVILFDNMTPSRLRKLCAQVRRMKLKYIPLLEVSGGVNLANVRSFAATGIDRISSGALTHEACHLDFSLEIL